MPKRPIFITGIGTGIGKTIISAIVTENLQADYWKPVQSGDLDNSDTLTVKSLISNPVSKFHEEAYRLTQPYSPHKSAAIDKTTINFENFILPKTQNELIIEGAGGLMVPLNDNFLMIDLIKQLDARVIVVSKNYLGSINHTLLSLFALQRYQIDIMGIIFNGAKDIYSKSYILEYSGIKELGHIPDLEKVNKKSILEATGFITL